MTFNFTCLLTLASAVVAVVGQQWTVETFSENGCAGGVFLPPVTQFGPGGCWIAHAGSHSISVTSNPGDLNFFYYSDSGCQNQVGILTGTGCQTPGQTVGSWSPQ
ncbi:hypothetical protein MVEN_00681100 [Mycena venus]|uniref:Uncharacterized protein n=1 Tax=Mycena venus TaxID=2733690 RepID=A0A8H7D2E5_9AGAR|nr:hypothetical protein MVEN_00681100 [Mycena venus]